MGRSAWMVRLRELGLALVVCVPLMSCLGKWPGGPIGGNPTTNPSGCADGGCFRRAHTTICTNVDGTISDTISMCADGCAETCEAAEQQALTGLATQVCLDTTGNQTGCCKFTVDDNFNVCGMPSN